MTIFAIIVALIFVVAASAQDAGLPVKARPVGLVFALPGGPLSAQQVEERTSTFPDGTSSTETLVSQIYRDSAGRIRIEWRMQGIHGESFGIVDLIDPVAYSIVTLLVDSKIANYLVAPHSSSGPFQVGLPAVGRPIPAGKRQAESEIL